MELNLRLLHALLVVAEEGSMTRAATRLNLTQQAVSGQIQQLERLAGATLLVRNSRGVELTPAGEVVARHGRQMLAAADRMLDETRRVAQGTAGRVRVAFKAQSTAHFMPQVVAALKGSDIDVEMTSVSTLNEEIELLTGGGADAAFLWLPAGDDRLDTAPVLTEPRVAALPPDHPLAGRPAVELAELADEPVIGPHSTVPQEVIRFWVIDPRPDGTPVRYGPEGRTPEECLQLVASHRGVWIAPASAADYFTHPRLAWVLITDAEPFELALAWPRGGNSPLLRTFLEHCRTIAGETYPPTGVTAAEGFNAPPSHDRA
ncbi:LysR family transcriptional regulator [Longimycelium tulufanense]|uniref:LysR family transcriptional regulator n=1 Tax=Longimycelium tulufanense TaxID=907463 RepID=A0A8J3C756_9PSEU|nr:LysR family transcriptional regulator [Longimycelium tulufanense]GGM32992.1 LysR family transcriptional regulator [Longimycelium tulufanense]